VAAALSGLWFPAVFAVPGQLGTVVGGEAAEAEGFVEAEGFAVGEREVARQLNVSVGGEGDQSAVKGGVEMGGEEETVVDVETFLIGGASCPWFDVARSQERRVADASDRAAVAPVVEQSGAEDILADAPDDEAFGLGSSAHGLGRDLEGAQGFVRQGAGQPSNLGDEVMKGRRVGYREGVEAGRQEGRLGWLPWGPAQSQVGGGPRMICGSDELMAVVG